jgi:hypothetical protein
MSQTQFCVKTFSESLRKTYLPEIETAFNGAGYIPWTVHRVSGGTRMVYGAAQTAASIALFIFIAGYGAAAEDKELVKEGCKFLDFAVHGAANVGRGFIEAHRVVHLALIIFDYYVPENNRLSYSQSFFEG